MPWSSITPGRALFSLVGLTCSLGPYIADWNETHIYNARWPPHAKFHNGQTMSMGLCLGLLTLYSTWNGGPDSQSRTLMTAAVAGLYWITGLSAVLYPGSKAIDPEFGEGNPQFLLFSGMLGASGVAWWLESSRLMGLGIRD